MKKREITFEMVTTKGGDMGETSLCNSRGEQFFSISGCGPGCLSKSRTAYGKSYQREGIYLPCNRPEISKQTV